MSNINISLILPCLNEAQTLTHCIEQSFKGLRALSDFYEVIVVDNRSSDNSALLAEKMGAVVVHQSIKGYGASLLKGIEVAQGKIIIMGDADASYNFSYESLLPFINACEDGADLVIGNRFHGGIEKGAMPLLHRYIGTPLMSMGINILFGTNLGDINCGLRAFKNNSIAKLRLTSLGMEFASEMIIRAAQEKLVIYEVPTTLSRDGRDRKPHLRSFRDGCKHVKLWIKLFFMQYNNPIGYKS